MAKKGVRLAVLIDHFVNEVGAIFPPRRMEEEGYSVTILTSTGEAQVNGEFGMVLSNVLKVGGSIRDADPADYDGVICAGGYAPDYLRSLPEVLSFVRALDQEGKLVAFIGHGAWIPMSAGLLKGRSAVTSRRIRSDLENAGAIWVDKPCVIDGNLVSGDLDYGAFCRGIVSVIEGGRVS